jgi:hypothetical protein
MRIEVSVMYYNEGDMLGVRKAFSVVYGIYAGKGKVIVFNPLAKGSLRVTEKDLGDFIGATGNAFIDTREEPSFDDEEVVARAKAFVGTEGKLPKFFTNSESFAMWAKTGHPSNTLMTIGKDISVDILNRLISKPIRKYLEESKTDTLRRINEKAFKAEVKSLLR